MLLLQVARVRGHVSPVTPVSATREDSRLVELVDTFFFFFLCHQVPQCHLLITARVLRARMQVCGWVVGVLLE